jgi:hypothetical protein
MTSSAAPTLDATGARSWTAALLVIACVELVALAVVPSESPIERGERFYPTWRQPTLEESLLQWQVSRAAVIDDAPSLLVLGDSTALMGVQPAVVHEVTGRTVENLGLFGLVSTHGIVEMYDWYRRFSPPPEEVVVHVGAFAFLLTDREVDEIEMLGAMRRWMGTSESVFAFWPSTRLRGNRGAAPRYDAQMLAQPRGVAPSDTSTRDQLVRERGYFEEPRRTESWREVVATPTQVRDDAVRGLVPLLERTAREGVRVVIVRAPLPELFRWPAYEEQVAEAGALLRAAYAEWDHVEVVEPWVRWMPVGAFATFEHLTRDGAAMNSAALASLLGARRESMRP